MSKITSLGRLEARFLVINDFAKFIEHPVMIASRWAEAISMLFVHARE